MIAQDRIIEVETLFKPLNIFFNINFDHITFEQKAGNMVGQIAAYYES